MLTATDKNYINKAIDTSCSRFQKDTERYLGILMERYEHESKLTRELIETRPSREEIKGMMREEVQPVKQEISMFKQEMSLFKKEMAGLRKDLNAHTLVCEPS